LRQIKSFFVPVKEKKQIFLSLEWESDKGFCQQERKKDKRVKEGFIGHRIEICDKMKVFFVPVKRKVKQIFLSLEWKKR